jgi:tRNA(His) guanylyltransferase
MDKTALGDRMKAYEKVYRYEFPNRTYIILRFDGRSFSKYTKQFDRPFDDNMRECMDYAAKELCKEISGARFAYVQSDEISVLVTNVDKIDMQIWFGGVKSKMESVGASIVSNAFNKRLMQIRRDECGYAADLWDMFASFKFAQFDGRGYLIPDRQEVGNYFVWRQSDCVRNSISMCAYSMLKGNRNGLTTSIMQDRLMAECNFNWNDLDAGYKRGRLITKESYVSQTAKNISSERTRWVSNGALWITKERDEFMKLIPEYKWD